MPPPAATRTPAQRRARLVQEAAQEFAARGYEQASLNRIISACGMSKSSFYHVVESKAALFRLVVDTLREDAGRRVQIPSPDAFAGTRFWETVRELLARLVAAGSDPSLATLGRIVYLGGLPDDSQAPVQSFFADVESWLGQVLQQGRSAGAVRDDMPPDLQLHLVFAVLRALDEWSVAQLDSPPDRMQQIVEAQLALVQRMLSPDPA